MKTSYRDKIKQQVLDRGWDVARQVLEAAGSEPKRLDARRFRASAPWREDQHPSLDVLCEPDGSTPAGSFIDRATETKGDVFTLCANVWGLDCKKDFVAVLERCCRIIGVDPEQPKQKRSREVSVEKREGTRGDWDDLAASYGLYLEDFEQFDCKLEEQFIPSLQCKVPCIVYPAQGLDGPIVKMKSLFRYEQTQPKGEPEHWAIRPVLKGKRQSAGKGCGWFPRAVAKAQGKGTIIVTGGEEKALIAIRAGFRAITFTHGEKQVSAELAAMLHGLGYTDVVLALDADAAGVKATTALAGVLMAAGFLSIRAVSWPTGTPDKWDLCDVARDQGIEALKALLRGAPALAGILPAIRVNNRPRIDIVNDARRIVLATNRGPHLFRRAGQLVCRREVSVHGQPDSVIDLVDSNTCYAMLIRSASWINVLNEGRVTHAAPPMDVVNDLLAMPDQKLPELESVIRSPIFGRSGRMIAQPGYHEDDAVWLQDTGLVIPPVPEQPTAEEIVAARELILDLFEGFPFATQSDRAHAVAALLVPFSRRLIEGPTPLHLIGAPVPGSGKSLIAGAIQMVCTGKASDVRTYPEPEPERQKFLFSELLKGPAIILLDNASNKRTLDSPTLAAVLSAPVYEDRLLGSNKTAACPNQALWMMTANNPGLSTELTRRCVSIRIDPRMDRPWMRSGFRHPDLIRYAGQNRGELVRACLTIVRAWIVAGRPAGSRKIGSFESYSYTMGGILEVGGIEGFLGNLETLYANADPEGNEWRAFVKLWWERYGRMEVTASDLAMLCRQTDMMERVLGDGTERSQASKLGRSLGKHMDRVFGKYRISSAMGRNGRCFYLVESKENAQGNTDDRGENTREVRNIGQCSADVPHSQVELFQDHAEHAEHAGHSYFSRTQVHDAQAHVGARLHSQGHREKVPQVPQVPHSSDYSSVRGAEHLRNIGRSSAVVEGWPYDPDSDVEGEV